VKSNLAEEIERIRTLALSRQLTVWYTPEVERELTQLGGNFAELLNIIRRETIEASNELKIKGHLDNGITIVAVGVPFTEVCEDSEEVISGLFVHDLYRTE
jgi:hypothetical protein